MIIIFIYIHVFIITHIYIYIYNIFTYPGCLNSICIWISSYIHLYQYRYIYSTYVFAPGPLSRRHCCRDQGEDRLLSAGAAGAMQRVLFPWKWGECIDYRLSLGRPWLGIWATSCCFCFFSGFSES